MEINNNVTNVNPQAENQGQQPASKAKKKGATEGSEFDASLLATLLTQGQGAKPEAKVEAATQVELSGKDAPNARSEGMAEMQKAMLKVAGAMNQAHAKAVATASQSGESAQMQFPDVNALIQTQTAKDANGTMTEAFVAGPNQPWSPNWVFGPEKSEIAQKMEGAQEKSPLADLMAQMQRAATETQGGDENHQALERLNQELGVSLTQLQEVAGEQTATPKQGQSMNRVGGEAFLDLLQGAQAQTQGGGGDLANGSGNGSGSQGQNPAQQQAQAFLANSGSTTSSGGLHVIDGGKSKPFAVGGSKEEGKLSPELLAGGAIPLALQAGPEKVLQPQAPVLTGHVVPGSMMRDRLTSETIRNMTDSLSSISARGGNGEMRIRMNPGNLGELMIKVTTMGNSVGLKVQATDPQAKKILEESLSSLKDGLAQQSLALTRVDISVAQPGQSASSQFGDSQQNLSQQGQANTGTMNFDGRGAQSQENRSSWSSGDSAPVDLRAARARAVAGMNSSSSGAARDASGRLNVIA